MKHKKIMTVLLATCLLVSICSGSIVTKAEEKNENSIKKINATFYEDTTSTKAFTWYTDKTLYNSDLQVVEKNNVGTGFSKCLKFKSHGAVSTNSSEEFVHKVVATGLKENTIYQYRVGDESKNTWSDIGTFKTSSKTGVFTFIDLADSQAKNEEEARLSGETIRKAFKAVPSADFIALNGDLVDKGQSEEQWNWLFKHSQNNLLNTTFVPVAGNHESAANSFTDHFNLKAPDDSETSSGAYYSYNYSNTHFVILNNNEDSDEYRNFTPKQIGWMKNDITKAKESGVKWTVVLMHKGPYTSSNHATDKDIMGKNGVRTKAASIIENLGVDLVLQGHDHIYARTKAIKNGKVVEENSITEVSNGVSINYDLKPDGTIYVIPSTAGPKVYYKNRDIDQSYYNNFAVADESHAAIYGADPSDLSRPKRSQVQNFMGITIDGDKLTAVVYEIDQNKDNAEPFIVDSFGISKVDKVSNGLSNSEGDKVNTTEVTNKKAALKTGDNSSIITLVFIIICALAIGVLATRKRKSVQ